MDRINIENLEIYAKHGVLEEEKKLGQRFLVSATLYTDTREAGILDDLNATINYSDVAHWIKKYMCDNVYNLIEAVAEGLAKGILLEFPRIKKIDLEIKKPWAPIGLPLEYVSVGITREWKRAYISVGSNMGNKEKNISDGIEAIEASENCRNLKVSTLIETEPFGYLEQENFLNGVLEIETMLNPKELLKFLQQIEKEAKRERKIRWGPRTLDLDILFYDNQIVDLPELQIPHIGIPERNFVLKPMMEIAPYFRHPVLNKAIYQLYKELEECNKNT